MPSQKLVNEATTELIKICQLHKIDFLTLPKKEQSLLMDAFRFGAAWGIKEALETK